MTAEEYKKSRELVDANMKFLREELNPAIGEKTKIFEDLIKTARQTAVEILSLLQRKQACIESYVKMVEDRKTTSIEDHECMEDYMRQHGNADWEMMHVIIGVINDHRYDEVKHCDEMLAKLKAENPIKKRAEALLKTVDGFHNDFVQAFDEMITDLSR